MWRSVHRTWLCLLSAFFCLGFAGTAQGATPQNTPGVTDLIRDRQDRLLEEQQRRSRQAGGARRQPLLCHQNHRTHRRRRAEGSGATDRQLFMSFQGKKGTDLFFYTVPS